MVEPGDTAGALVSYRKAEVLAAGAGANDWEMLAVLVQARRTIAQIETRSGHYSEAVTLLQSTLEPARRLWKEAPPDLQINGEPVAALAARTNLTLGYTLLNAANAAHPGMPDVAGTRSQYLGLLSRVWDI